MNYIIVYNNSQLQFDSAVIHKFITKNLNINDWWHYLSNVYIVGAKSGVNAKNLADSITQNFPGLIYFITQVNLYDHNGVLPKNAWDWINNKIRQVFKLKPIPKPKPLSISDMFPSLQSSKSMQSLPNTLANFLRSGGYK